MVYGEFADLSSCDSRCGSIRLDDRGVLFERYGLHLNYMPLILTRADDGRSSV